MYNKLPYLKWVLPNAPHNHEAMSQAWYLPKAFPNPMKPKVPGQEEEEVGTDDVDGIMRSVRHVDQLVQEEVDRGIEPGRIVVGGFSMGCAIALIWGLVSESQLREKIAGVVGLSGYLPMVEKLQELQRSADTTGKTSEEKQKKWFIVHGTKDMLVPTRLFESANETLSSFVDPENLETHVYTGMGHSTSAAELRDLLKWLEQVVPG
jgi:predicted esterase